MSIYRLKRVHRIITVALAVYSLAVTIAICLAFGTWLIGYRLLTVQTASMVPVFHPGDALLTKPIVSHDLKVGQIISYRRPDNQKIIISHRLVARTKQGLLITAGDALHSKDPAFSAHQLIGQTQLVLPRLGHWLDVMHRPAVAIGFIYLPACIWLIAEFWNFDMRRSTDRYQHPIYRYNS